MKTRTSLAAVVVVVVLTAGLAILGWPANDYRDVDFAHFWVGSRALLDGRDPYQLSTWLAYFDRIGSRGLSNDIPGIGYRYPFTTAVVFVPFALLPISFAAPLWLVVQLALVLFALVTIASTVFPATVRRDRPVLLAFAAGSQPIWVLAAGGNIGGFLLAIAAGSASLLLRSRPFAAGALAGFLVVKPHPLLVAFPLLLLAVPRSTATALLRGAALTAVPLLLASLALRPGWIGEWLGSLGAVGATRAHATLFGLVPRESWPFAMLVLVLMGTAFVVWARVARPLALVIGTAIPLSLFGAPYLWSYDHSLLLITVAVVLATAAPAPTNVRVAALGLLVLAGVALPWYLYWLAFRRGEESWSAVVPLAMLLTLVASRRLIRWRAHGAEP